MSHAISRLIEFINQAGTVHWQFASAMFWQASLVIGAVFALDLLLLRRGRSNLRYAVWSLVLIKLLMPVTIPGLLSWSGLAKIQESVTDISYTPPVSSKFTPSVQTPAISGTAEPVTLPVSSSYSELPDVIAPIRQPSLQWPGCVFLGWASIVSGLLTLLIRQMRMVQLLIAKSSPAPAELSDDLRHASQALGSPPDVTIRVTDQLNRPAICGFWTPTILVPTSLLGSLEREQMQLVITHELTHWRRWDLQVNFLQSVLQIVYFYNPLVWGANSMIRRIREYVVDEATVAAVGSPVQRYSNTLIEVADHACRTPRTAPALMGVVNSASVLYRRIQRLSTRPFPANVRLSWLEFAAVILFGLALLPLGDRQARAEADELIPAVTEKTAIPEDGDEDQEPPQADAPGMTPDSSEVEVELVKNGQWKQLLRDAGLTEQEQSKLNEVAVGELVGVILDETTGKPIAGVKVDAWHWAPGNDTTTDEKGMFRIPGLDTRGKIEVMITKEGYCPRVFAKRPTGGKSWFILLSNQTYLEGTVLGVDGQPVADATIRAQYGPVEIDGGIIGEIQTETQTREDGTYRLYVSPQTYEIQASAPGRGIFRTASVQIDPDMARSFPITLTRAVHFEAKVIDSLTGDPVEGFALFRWQPPYFTGRSDQAGRIEIDDLLPGKMEMQCGGGEAQKFGEVTVYQSGPYGRWWSEEAINPWQRFDPGQDAGWQRNLDDLTFDLQLDMKPVTIVVEQGVTVSGRVTDPRGNPVEGATVAPAKTGSGNSLTGDTRYSVKTDRDGKYSTVLPASNEFKYNLMVHDGDYQEWRNWANGVSEVMQTKPGQKIENFDLQLTEPAVIKGIVKVNGKPAPDHEVRTHDFSKMENRYYDPTVRTAEDGTFELRFVRPGKHYLQAAPFYLSAEDTPATKIIETKAGEVQSDFELIATPQ